jgi:hypothetical protein
MIETARREIERTRQVQELLRRARARLSEGSFEGVIRAVGEILAIDPQNGAARELQARAQEALEQRERRAGHDVGANAAVAHARELFDGGDREGAIAMLEAFRPPHDLVTGFLASLRGESSGEPIDVAPTPDVPSASASAPAVAPDPASRSVFVYAAAAIVVLAIGGTVVFKTMRGERPGDPVTPAPAQTTAAATTPAPAAAPPVAVTPPAALTEQPPQNQNDRDAMDAYRLLASGDHAEAAKIVGRIARRDPKNERLADLRAQIQKVSDAERERQRAAAAAAVPATVTHDTNPPPPVVNAATAPIADKPSTPPAVPAVLPPPNPDPAPVPVPRSSGEVERPAIEAAIAEYARALSNRDLPAVARVRRYTPAEARSWDNIFKQFSEYRLLAKVIGPPAVDGDRARVPVEETFAQTSKKGGIQVFTQPRKTEYLLEKIGGKWMILPPA